MAQDIQQVDARLATARDAYERHAWREAFESLRELDAAGPLAGEDLQRLAEAAWFAGEPEAAVQARGRAYSTYLAEDDPCAAALMAVRVALDHFDRLEIAIGQGWLARAGRLLDGVSEPCAAHGWQAMVQVMFALDSGDLQEARELARRMQELGRQVGDEALQTIGLELEGIALVHQGEVEAGMALVDEATVSVVTGNLDPLCTGIIYCCTISVCRDLTDWERARQWTEEAERWCGDHGMSGFPGICRVHRAEVLGIRGSWADAEREARRAAEELARYDLNVKAEALYQVGEIRLRVGDLEGARQAFSESRDLGREPEPGLSLLRAAEGDLAGAHSSIRRSLEDSTGFQRLRRLPVAVDLALAAGAVDEAAAHVEELEHAASNTGKPALEGTAALARGRVALANGELREAASSLRRAIERWNRVGAPYEVARARMGLGEVLLAEGDEPGARFELEAARATFERLGALPDARRVDGLLGGAGVATASAGDRVTRTFVFTDIVGSTSLAEALGDQAWQELIRWHDQELRSHFARHGGAEVRQTGDGFFVAFPDAIAALDAAVAIQRALQAHRAEHGFSPSVRIGIHEAEATVRGHDFAGVGVHAAARIAALAEGGQILVSRDTLPASLRFPVGEGRTVELKGVSQPIEVVPVEWR